jgi:Acyclic terpene utilisation family protein AtuA
MDGTMSLRIGCGSGFWGDTALGAAQLVERGNIDVLVLDYLAEITMSILARMRAKRPDAGYATDFVDGVISPLAAQLAAKQIKVIANAGGVNPAACKAAVERVLAAQGISLEVAIVTGDDITDQLAALRAAGTPDLETGRGLPEHPLSANAYLGAFPIAEALRRGADIVITGRCVDSALALGPLVAKFGWKRSDLDQLAQGSLAGHVIECGVQGTGGISTDWRLVERGYAEMGFPIVECEADGSFVITKPYDTGGLVAPATVAEQIVYEVHDPARYMLPDVVCDFTRVTLEQVGPDRVRITGARGLAPPATYKASITYADGFRLQTTLFIVGHDARQKAERVGAAIFERVNRINATRGLAPFRATSIEALGSERYFGAASRALATREVVLALGAHHDQEAALATLAREIAPAATSMVQSITGFAGGRPNVQPVVRLASCLVPKSMVTPAVTVDDIHVPVPPEIVDGPAYLTHVVEPEADVTPAGPLHTVPLRWLARGRSGDKGNTANIGILARAPELVPILRDALTAERVKAFLGHLILGSVRRFDWPGLSGWNFVCGDALGGGGIASLRFDPQGKALAQILLEMPIDVPAALNIADPDAA